MALFVLTCLVLVLGCACAAPTNDGEAAKAGSRLDNVQDDSDLKADASTTYGRRYSDWGGYPGNSYVTGYGILDDKYSGYNGGYDNNQFGVRGYNKGYGYNGYAGNSGYGGYKGYSGFDSSAGGVGGYGPNQFGASGGYGNAGSYGGYGNAGSYGGYGNAGSYGGYGGYGGNGGINSYYGYNNPSYQGAGHLGYGYTKPGYGNIYGGGITPSLVTGYRGYSRR